jgi:hypothetical protein
MHIGYAHMCSNDSLTDLPFQFIFKEFSEGVRTMDLTTSGNSPQGQPTVCNFATIILLLTVVVFSGVEHYEQRYSARPTRILYGRC